MAKASVRQRSGVCRGSISGPEPTCSLGAASSPQTKTKPHWERAVLRFEAKSAAMALKRVLLQLTLTGLQAPSLAGTEGLPKLLPHAHTEPSEVSARECELPQAMAVT
ncbi:hypothetical protein TYRP_017142 [Tyrophagus putrescentiae]|nr:hypothetical protein TYRP_017142 [Tyrophagus putrescentiae]